MTNPIQPSTAPYIAAGLKGLIDVEGGPTAERALAQSFPRLAPSARNSIT